jgi:hypothetical protein
MSTRRGKCSSHRSESRYATHLKITGSLQENRDPVETILHLLAVRQIRNRPTSAPFVVLCVRRFVHHAGDSVTIHGRHRNLLDFITWFNQDGGRKPVPGLCERLLAIDYFVGLTYSRPSAVAKSLFRMDELVYETVARLYLGVGEEKRSRSYWHLRSLSCLKFYRRHVI